VIGFVLIATVTVFLPDLLDGQQFDTGNDLKTIRLFGEAPRELLSAQ
jgi:hypothetical protein